MEYQIVQLLRHVLERPVASMKDQWKIVLMVTWVLVCLDRACAILAMITLRKHYYLIGSYSCTIFLNGKKRAVRDGGRWRETIPPNRGNSVEDFVNEICNSYQGTDLPDACRK